MEQKNTLQKINQSSPVDIFMHNHTPWWNDPKIIEKTPILTSFLVIFSCILQIIHMYQEQSSLGQSPWYWLMVCGIFLLWANFYRIFTPNSKLAYDTTMLSLSINLLVLATVLKFEHLWHLGFYVGILGIFICLRTIYTWEK